MYQVVRAGIFKINQQFSLVGYYCYYSSSIFRLVRLSYKSTRTTSFHSVNSRSWCINHTCKNIKIGKERRKIRKVCLFVYEYKFTKEKRRCTINQNVATLSSVSYRIEQKRDRISTERWAVWWQSRDSNDTQYVLGGRICF